MDGSEKRKYKRFGAKFDISCIDVGSFAEHFQTGSTVNVSTGGLYFETSADLFKQGNLLKVQLTIPPTSGLLEFGGKISGFARILRTDDIRDLTLNGNASSERYGVAIEFCRPPRLCM